VTLEVAIVCRCGAAIGDVTDGVLNATKLREGLVPLRRDRRRGPGEVTEADVNAAVRADLAPPIEFDTQPLRADVETMPPVVTAWCDNCGTLDLRARTVRAKRASAVSAGKRKTLRVAPQR
jgi:hypothetical protein